MRPLRSLLIYLLVVFVGGALVAPWMFQLVQTVAPDSHLAHNPFHRYLNRALLIFALAGMWPLLKGLGATHLRDTGLVSPKGQGGRVGLGFAFGFVSLAWIASIVILTHGRSMDSQLGGAQWLVKLLGAAGTAVGVAFMEELLFRGAVFGGLRRTMNWKWALLFSSMIYAIVHFMRSADIEGPVDGSSGFRLLPVMLRGFGEMQVVIPGFLNLTLVGLMLGYAYQRTGNLYFPMGLHAGWIFWMKFYASVTREVPEASTRIWGTHKLYDGWLAMVILTITLIALVQVLKREKEFHSQ